jgi:hypothetical protein
VDDEFDTKSSFVRWRLWASLTFTTSPSTLYTLATTPPKRLVISTVALSLCTSHTLSNARITSPSYKTL